MDPLQVAMTGVRMGERYLQVFCSDDTLTRGLATKSGLSGVAAIAAPDEVHEKRARRAGEEAGVLIDVKTAAVTSLGWSDHSFDMVVIDNTSGEVGMLGPDHRAACLREAHRVLRPGGRIEVIESMAGGMLRRAAPASESYLRAGGAEGVLRAAGFQPVRILAEKDGYRFVEGLRAHGAA